MWTAEAKLRIFLTSALDGNEWSIHALVAFSRKEFPVPTGYEAEWNHFEVDDEQENSCPIITHGPILDPFVERLPHLWMSYTISYTRISEKGITNVGANAVGIACNSLLFILSFL
jgi:hypothetical protein